MCELKFCDVINRPYIDLGDNLIYFENLHGEYVADFGWDCLEPRELMLSSNQLRFIADSLDEINKNPPV